MESPKKQWTLYCIHHSHTDIGYTDAQEEMEFHHVQFLRQVLDILGQGEKGRREWEDFKWNCESAWCVEKFLEQASPQEKELFFRYVREGKIGVSGSYLNLTELVSDRVLRQNLERVQALLGRQGIAVRSAMTADVNGYSWGFAGALLDAGVENLLCCLHTHHGYHPTFQKQNPFYWEAPSGKKLFVWNGEHYLLGNELGLAQEWEFNYTIQDGLPPMEDRFRKAELRLYAYVRTMEEQGYPYSFLPVTVSGMMTDNGPPNVKIIQFIREFNARHGREIQLKMVTLQEFFDAVKDQVGEIPTYSGDWTDWWADGVGSTPNIVSHYREASRLYDMVESLDPRREIVTPQEREAIAYNLIFYGEHTWGYSSSITEPWHPNVNYLDLRKALFAQKANELAHRAMDKIEESKGKTALSLYHDYRFRIINPHQVPVSDMSCVNMETLYGHERFQVVDEATGEAVPYQLGSYARGYAFQILAELAPGQERTYALREVPPPELSSCGRVAERGHDTVRDLHRVYCSHVQKGACASPFALENQFFRISYEEGRGITSLFHKGKGMELVLGGPAFQPIYEVTPAGGNQQLARRDMGRNRKAVHTRRSYGVMDRATVLEEGPLYSRVELGYALEGASECALVLTLYHHTPRLDVDFRLHKASVWDPENLYLSLPFNACTGEDQVWLDKTGCVFRPRVDQLPGTCTDFYLTQNGAAIRRKGVNLLLGLRDTPLVAMGDIKAHPIRLCGEPGVENDAPLYAWLMNNFWETNFKASLGGFHQYRFTLAATEEESPQAWFRQLAAINGGVVSFYQFDR